jgi:hypothetical protein
MTAQELLDLIKSYCIEVGDCWEWQRSFNSGRVPTMALPRILPMIPGTKMPTVTVHSLVWEVLHGPRKRGQVAYRTCLNGACVNPDHIKAGTRKQLGALRAKSGVASINPHQRAKHQKKMRQRSNLVLDMDRAREIRDLQGTGSAREIGQRYGVSDSLVHQIWNNLIWREASNNTGYSVFSALAA